MVDQDLKQIQRRLQRLSREYRENGYDVHTSPGLELLPEFLHEFSPLLLATRGDESVVAEIGTTDALAASDRISRLAAAIEQHKGWRLDFVVIGTTDDSFGDDEERVHEHTATLERRLREAQHLTEQGNAEAALLLAWSSAEGILRLASARAGVATAKMTVGTCIRQLYSLGLISKATYELLLDRMQTRNRVAHGELAPAVAKADVLTFIDEIHRARFELLNNDFPSETHAFTASIINEFESLLNAPNTPEVDFQRFFERHPEFLVKWGHLEVHQAPSGADDVSPVPDFVLTNPTLNASAIVELKHPSSKLLIGEAGRARPSRVAMEGRSQLLQYRDWLRDPKNRELVEEKYGIELFEPRLMLVIGRGSGFDNAAFKAQQRAIGSNVEIVTYDDLLQFARDSAKLQKKRTTK